MREPPSILTPALSGPSPELLEAQRVRRLCLRALRERKATSFTARTLAKHARCELQVAQSALHTLAAWKHVVKRGEGFELAPVEIEAGRLVR